MKVIYLDSYRKKRVTVKELRQQDIELDIRIRRINESIKRILELNKSLSRSDYQSLNSD
jgi:hypothetical protein